MRIRQAHAALETVHLLKTHGLNLTPSAFEHDHPDNAVKDVGDDALIAHIEGRGRTLYHLEFWPGPADTELTVQVLVENLNRPQEDGQFESKTFSVAHSDSAEVEFRSDIASEIAQFCLSFLVVNEVS